VKFLEHRYEDIAPIDFILSRFPKEEILKITNPDSVGRKPRKVAERLNSVIVRMFWEKVMNNIMESQVMEIDKYTKLYIGVTGKKGDGRQVKYRKKKLTYMHQRNIFGVVLNGFFHSYYFSIPSRRRQELVARLKKGQTFIV